MARYKPIDHNLQLWAVDLQAQLQPGTFEHALRQLIDEELDLSDFDARYCNDATGASAYAPAVLLKVVLFAYSRGILSSRSIERACRENVLFSLNVRAEWRRRWCVGWALYPSGVRLSSFGVKEPGIFGVMEPVLMWSSRTIQA